MHKTPLSNDRIIAVFQEVCFPALFVRAAVNLLKAPAQHSAGVGRALSLQDFTLGPGCPGRGSGAASAAPRMRRGHDVVALSSTGWALRFWECLQGLKAALLPFLMELFRPRLWPVSFSRVPTYLLACHQLYFLCLLRAVSLWGYLLPEKQKENVFRLGLLMIWMRDSMCDPASGMHHGGVMTHPTAGWCIANYTFVALIGI